MILPTDLLSQYSSS